MSLSRKSIHNGPLTGRVFLSTKGETTHVLSVQQLEGKKPPEWDQDFTREYVARVRERVRQKATEMLEQAMAEADGIRRKAYEDGFADGIKDAQTEIAEKSQDLSVLVGNMLTQIQDQARNVWEQQRIDLVTLVHMAIEKTLECELSSQRSAIMEKLLHEALEHVETDRELTLVVAPADEMVVEALLNEAKTRYPRLKNWTIHTDPAMEPGGVVVETDRTRVDNTLNERWSGVAGILNQLTLPDPDPVDPQTPAAAQDPAQDTPSFDVSGSAPSEPHWSEEELSDEESQAFAAAFPEQADEAGPQEDISAASELTEQADFEPEATGAESPDPESPASPDSESDDESSEDIHWADGEHPDDDILPEPDFPEYEMPENGQNPADQTALENELFGADEEDGPDYVDRTLADVTGDFGDLLAPDEDDALEGLDELSADDLGGEEEHAAAFDLDAAVPEFEDLHEHLADDDED